ncbi:hypothetical protein KBC04_00525 [Candidatus Babeliales bacterium]|nr:hypothetical protein [Candidatus Babeliales bacterium]MBP9843423.1 hypothetical protein [Candidatus Babeliales bacterium]
MNFKILSLFICLSSCLLNGDNYHNQLIIPGVNIANPYWEFASQQIAQRKDDSFAQLVTKWNEKLDELWDKLASKIYEEIYASTNQIDGYLDDQRFIDVYMNYYRQGYAEFIDETEPQEIDPVILNFITSKLYYLQLPKQVKICVTDKVPVFATSFGTDPQGHYLIINDEIYSAEKINEIYEFKRDDKLMFFIENATGQYLSRIVEYRNLLHFEIARALSSVIHQHDYFAKMLIIFIFNKRVLTKETQTYGENYTIFQSYIEACLQTNNPFEIAVFMEPYIDNLNQEHVLLWRELIEDLENCYNEDDLATYKELALKHRRAALYTSQDDN